MKNTCVQGGLGRQVGSPKVCNGGDFAGPGVMRGRDFPYTFESQIMGLYQINFTLKKMMAYPYNTRRP